MFIVQGPGLCRMANCLHSAPAAPTLRRIVEREVTMNPLTKALLALAITHAPPARSPFSLEPMPACGSDPAAPTCELEPVCAEIGRASCREGGEVRVVAGQR